MTEKEQNQKNEIAEEDLIEETELDEEEALLRLSFRERMKFHFSCCPKACFVLICIGVFSLLMLVLFSLIPAFSDFYNRHIGAWLRAFLAFITKWFPFSLAECVIISSPLLIGIMIYATVRVYKKTIREMNRLIFVLLSIIAVMFSMFVLVFSASYRGSSLDEKLSLERKDVSAQELYDTGIVLLENLNEYIDKVTFSESGASVMPYSFSELNDKLQTAYVNAAEKYDFLPVFDSRIKQIVLSKPMTYTHISGVYTYFTGESNINVNFPDYTISYTAAHELAHQRGIGPEDEANFVAFLVSLESDDPYVKYSAYMNVFEYVINALYSADEELYLDVINKADSRLIHEMIAYNDFFEKYEKNIAASVSGVINDTYLKSQGQKSGSKSYGLVIDLTVAYYKSQNKVG